MSESKKTTITVIPNSPEHIVEGTEETIKVLLIKLLRLERLEELMFLTYVDTDHSIQRVMWRMKRCAQLRYELGLIEPEGPPDPEVEEL